MFVSVSKRRRSRQTRSFRAHSTGNRNASLGERNASLGVSNANPGARSANPGARSAGLRRSGSRHNAGVGARSAGPGRGGEDRWPVPWRGSMAATRSIPGAHLWRSMRSHYLGSPATRRRFIRQVGSIAVSVGIGLFVFNAITAAEQTRRQWGLTVSVLIATRAIEAGTVIGSEDLAARRIPVALAPDGALRSDVASTPRVVGRRVRASVTSGEILTTTDLSQAGGGRLGALAGEGRSALTVPLSSTHPQLDVGDEVDLYGAVLPTTSADADIDARPTWNGITGMQVGRVAERAELIESGADSATVLVASSEVADVLTATTIGPVTLVVPG